MLPPVLPPCCHRLCQPQRQSLGRHLAVQSATSRAELVNYKEFISFILQLAELLGRARPHALQTLLIQSDVGALFPRAV